MNRLFFICILLFSVKSYSDVNLQVIEVGSQDVNGNFPIITEILSWTENDTDANPCYSESGVCYIGPDVLYLGGQYPSLNGSCNYSSNCLEIHSYKTRKEVLDAYTARYGIPRRAQFNISSSDYDCVSMFYVPRKPTSGDSTDVNYWPGSSCGKIPPVTLTCNTDLPTEIDHGVIGIGDLDNGNSIFSDLITVRTWCNSSDDVAFQLYVTNKDNTKYLSMNEDSTLLSEILIDGKSGYGGVELIVKPGPSGSTSTLQSRLFATGISTLEAKEYTGNVVITASYQ